MRSVHSMFMFPSLGRPTLCKVPHTKCVELKDLVSFLSELTVAWRETTGQRVVTQWYGKCPWRRSGPSSVEMSTEAGHGAITGQNQVATLCDMLPMNLWTSDKMQWPCDLGFLGQPQFPMFCGSGIAMGEIVFSVFGFRVYKNTKTYCQSRGDEGRYVTANKIRESAGESITL